MIDLDELERLAKAAGSLPWSAEGDIICQEFPCESEAIARVVSSHAWADDIADHIAANSPAAILALTAEVRRLRAENESLALARLSGDSPKRAVTLELATALYNFATQIDRNEVSRSGVSGGYHAGYTYTYTSNEAPSHDEYFAAVDVWLESRKAHPKEGV